MVKTFQCSIGFDRDIVKNQDNPLQALRVLRENMKREAILQAMGEGYPVVKRIIWSGHYVPKIKQRILTVEVECATVEGSSPIVEEGELLGEVLREGA